MQPFLLSFFIGNRASDLGRTRSSDLKFTLTKTFRGGKSCPFVLEPFKNNEVCPVSWYLSVCHFLSIELAGGYIFRTTDRPP